MPTRHPPFARRLAILVLAAWAPIVAAQPVDPAAPPPTAAPQAAEPTPEPAAEPTPPAPEPKPSAPTEPATAPSQTIEVTGRNNPTDQRRQSTAGKIIIGRDEIERFGDSTLPEVLRRLPGVTSGGRPGRGGGDVRMRGMGGGYTQILIDGQRIPPGFSLDSLSPEQVERIEVLRAPTAEYGTRAVAGTINIVLREALQRTSNDVKLALTQEGSRVQPNLSWTRNDALGGSLGDTPGNAYNLSGSVYRYNRIEDSETVTTTVDPTTGEIVLRQRETGDTSSDREGGQINGRLQLKPGPLDQITAGFFLLGSRSTSETARTLVQDIGTEPPPPWANAGISADNRYTVLRLNGQWNRQLDEATKMELRFNGGGFTSDGQSRRRETDAQGNLTQTREEDASIEQDSLTLGGKLSYLWRDQHSLVSGWEAERIVRREARETLIDGLPQLEDFGDQLRAESMRLALYAQDEWNPNPQWSAYAGLRWEGIRTTSSDASNPVENTSSVLSPLFQAVYRPDPKSRDQIRMSLTQSYRSPALASLIARPTLSVDDNSPTNPDRAGNPALKPERAWGVEAAWEHYFAGGGLASANYFRRNISDLIRSVTSLQSVPWSPDPRWVSQQQNIGDAMTQGIELEFKARLSDLWPEAPRVQLNTNLSFFDSRVEAVPGPDNRLVEQPRGTLNLGADYRLPGVPLTLGGNFNLTPTYTTRLSDNQVVSASTKRSIEAYGLWVYSPRLQVRLSLAELAPLEYRTSNSVASETAIETSETRTTANRQVTLRLEWRL